MLIGKVNVYRISGQCFHWVNIPKVPTPVLGMQLCMQTGNGLTYPDLIQAGSGYSLVPRPHPAYRHLQYEKRLGGA